VGGARGYSRLGDCEDGCPLNQGSSVSFLGAFLRDLRVLTREFLPFVLRVGMQPLLFLFVFTFILPRMGGGNPMAAAAGRTSAPSCCRA
jgi:hypothetical protein